MSIIGPEDYLEPQCVLCGDPYGAVPECRPVPQKRIMEKMDEYMSRRDYAGAERHLLYWLNEAELARDGRGELMILGELVGHYRKTGEKEKAFSAAGRALDLIGALDFEGTVSAGTAYVNIATAFSSFGEHERALAVFEKARAAYESAGAGAAGSGEGRSEAAGPDAPAPPGEGRRTAVSPELYGGLCNNMALTLTALGRWAEARELYGRALKVMEQVPGGALEQAVTCLNMADTAAAEYGPEEGESEIFDLLDRAEELLRNADAPEDGYFAYVLDKCAPVFSHYGYFAAAREFREKAERLYAASADH